MTDTATFHSEDDMLAAELALGLLEGDDLTQARARAARDAVFAGHVAAWHERLAAMADELPDAVPSAAAKRALLARLFPDAARPSIWQRVGLWQGISVAALGLAAVMFVMLSDPATIDPDPQVANTIYATQMQAEGSDLQVLAVYDPARGDVAINRLAGVAPEGRVLELWAILPDTPPISLGVMSDDPSSRIAVPENVAAQAASITFAVTDEPPGGAPEGTPTGSVLAAGPVAEL